MTYCPLRYVVANLIKNIKMVTFFKVVTKSDQIWGFGKKKNPASIENQLLTGLCRTRSRDRTGTDCSTGVWDQRVYRFRHPGNRRLDLLVKDCKGIGNFGNCKINDIPWTENPIELTKVELKTFYNSEYHGTLDGNIRESVQGICCQVCSARYVQTQSILQLSSPPPGRGIVQNTG